METQNSAGSKRELNEYQLRFTRLQDDLNGLQREKDQSASLISSLQERVKRYFHIFLKCESLCRSLRKKKI